METWDYEGWRKHGTPDNDGWNATLLAKFNMVAGTLGYQLIIIPTHLKPILEETLELLDSVGENTGKDIFYRDSDEDIIEINGIGLKVLNFNKK